MNERPKYNPQIHHRRSIRLKGYDYTQAGAYFITLCTHQRQALFGEVVGGEMRLSPLGQVAAAGWLRLAQFFPRSLVKDWVVMPNHVHAIVILVEPEDGSSGAGKGEASALGSSGIPTRSLADASPQRPNGTQSGSINAILQNYKSIVARKINAQRGTPGAPVWQRNYYEHIIRDETSYLRIAEYIRNNPARWELDQLFVGKSA